MKQEKISVMQMIDSLDMGGAERVCVNYANAISELNTQYTSHLCVTRSDGLLREFIKPNVGLFFMHKKKFLDFEAYKRLANYIREHNIQIIHAHTSSFLTAIIIKLFTGVKVIWHDHTGHSSKINASLIFKVRTVLLKASSFGFSFVISVNKILQEWAQETLYMRKGAIEYLPNYAELYRTNKEIGLPGSKQTRIVSLANLRPVKDHLNLLNAFNILYNKGFKKWHIILVGNINDKEYLKKIESFIREHSLENNIHILGARSDAADILFECSIGVISSETEGLPMALLEYGLASLSVVSTNVGECPHVLEYGKYGFLAEPKNAKDLADKLEILMDSEETRAKFSAQYYEHVQSLYSKEAVLGQLLEIYKKAVQ